MRKATAAACAIGATAIAAALGGAPGAAPSDRPSAAAAPRVTVRPDIQRVGAPSLAGPPTTAYCERAYGIACYRPAQLRAAYHLPPAGTGTSGTGTTGTGTTSAGSTGTGTAATGKGTTIAVVDPYGSPTIARDLGTFDRQFGLPAPPSLRAVAPAGRVPTYNPNSPMPSWAQETTLDVEYAHAVAPGANILVVETPVSETEGIAGFPQIVAAEKYVISHHLADVISQSFDATEQTFADYRQLGPLREAYELAARDHVTVLASSGDNGAADVKMDGTTYYTHPVTSWPGSDPLVTAVGGTGMAQTANGGYSPVVWNDTYDQNVASPGPSPNASGGGRSVFFPRPGYQDSVADVTGGARGVPDVSMNAACSSAVPVYGSYAGGPGGWSLNCGTSEAAPEFAGIVALADAEAGHPLGPINPVLYMLSAVHAPGIVDVTRGNNTVSFAADGKSGGRPSGESGGQSGGESGGQSGGQRVTVPGFAARPGYDLASGVGTVDARYLVSELAEGGFLNQNQPEPGRLSGFSAGG